MLLVLAADQDLHPAQIFKTFFTGATGPMLLELVLVAGVPQTFQFVFKVIQSKNYATKSIAIVDYVFT